MQYIYIYEKPTLGFLCKENKHVVTMDIPSSTSEFKENWHLKMGAFEDHNIVPSLKPSG